MSEQKPGPLARLANAIVPKESFAETYSKKEWATVEEVARFYEATHSVVASLAREAGILVEADDQNPKAMISVQEFHTIAQAQGWCG